MDAERRIPVKITNLLEKTGTSEEDRNRLRQMVFDAAMETIRQRQTILAKGGNIHGVNHRATAKRRAANKRARQARKANR